MSDPRTMVVKEIRIATDQPSSGGTGDAAAPPAPFPGVLRKALALIVGLTVLAVIIPLGLLAVGCVTLIGVVVLVVWAFRRALGTRASGAARPAPDTQRENVRIRTPTE